MLKFLLIASLAVPAFASPAFGQVRTPEQRDAEYEACYNEHVSRGFDEGYANTVCYEQAYGNEGGYTPPPTPPQYCTPDRRDPCTPQTAPN